MTKDEFRKAVDDVIEDCLRNDSVFGDYAHKVTDAVWPVLEAAEKEREALRAENAALVEDMNLLRNNNVALRAKIAEMERQEPVKYEFQDRDGKWYPFIDQRHYENTVAVGAWPIRSLYALPGAKGE